MVTKRRLGLCSNHGPIRFRRPIRRRNSRRRSERRGAGRLAAAALAPARRADCYADQPTVGTSISVLGAFAERAGRRRRSGRWRGVLRRRQPRFAGSSSSPRSAVRRGAAPAPRLARRDRLRRPDAPSRAILPRCATPSIFRPTPTGTRPPAPPGASIGCGAVSPRLRSGLTNQACARPPICSNCRETSISKRWPGGCGVSFKAKKILWRRRRAPVRRRRERWTARHARKPRFWRCG